MARTLARQSHQTCTLGVEVASEWIKPITVTWRGRSRAIRS